MNAIIKRIQDSLSNIYPILKDIKIVELSDYIILKDTECVAVCKFDEKYEIIKETTSLKILKYKPIEIKLKTKMPNDYLVITFVHECAHAITLTTIKKIEDKWITDNDHGDDFYKNFAILLRYLESKKIFILNNTKGYSKYSIRNLQKLDRYNHDVGALPVGKYFSL